MFISALLLTSCMKHDFDKSINEKISQNVKSVFGVEFDPNHDWCTTNSGKITVTDIPAGIDKVQLLTYITENDTATSVLILNEAYVNGKSSISISYDVPIDNLGLYVSFIYNGSCITKQVTGNNASFGIIAMTRSMADDYVIPTVTSVIAITVELYASQRVCFFD